MSNIREFMAHPIKFCQDSVENRFVVSFCFFLFSLFLLKYFKYDTVSSLIGVVSWIILILALINYLIVIFKGMWTKERYTLFMIILLMVVIFVPSFYIGDWEQLDSFNTFLTIVIGIGINYAIDSVFEVVKADNVPSQKKSLQQKSAFTKLFFNCLYISECISFMFIKNCDYLKFINNHLKVSNQQVIFIFLTLIIWVLFLSISILFIIAVRSELKNDSKQDLESLKIELLDKKEHILNVRKQLMDIDKKMIATFDEIELNYEAQLTELEQIIKADASEK